MRSLSVLALLLVAGLTSGCNDSDDAGVSADKTGRLCAELSAWREEVLLGDGHELSSNVDDSDPDFAAFYMSLREFVPPSVKDDIEDVAAYVDGGDREVPPDVRDAAERIGSYFYEQCLDELVPE